MTDPEVIQFFALAQKLGMHVESDSFELVVCTGYRLGIQGYDEDEYVKSRFSW